MDILFDKNVQELNICSADLFPGKKKYKTLLNPAPKIFKIKGLLVAANSVLLEKRQTQIYLVVDGGFYVQDPY